MAKGDILQTRFSQRDEKTRWMCFHADFTRVWNTLTCWVSKGVPKPWFLESGLTKSLTVLNFRNKVGMTIIIFSKCYKSNIVSRNGRKIFEKVFNFQDNWIWTGVKKFSYSRTGYFSLVVNMLPSNTKI